ncbi:MAG: hypothetical protein SCM96_08685 [Acidobacteriota bacterium]|nr:hypothetical protein [Acidobacteriota bacterium]
MPRIGERMPGFNISHLVGPVADPGPDVLLDKVGLVRIKLEMLNQNIIDLKNQIKIAEIYRDMLKAQYKLK